MKSHSRTAETEKMWNDVLGVIQDNMLLAVMALKTEFGFGDVRMQRFLDAVNTQAEIFHQQAEDNVLDIKQDGNRQKYRYYFKKILRETARDCIPEKERIALLELPNKTLSDVRRETKQREKLKQVSIKQAQELTEKLQMAQKYFEKVG